MKLSNGLTQEGGETVGIHPRMIMLPETGKLWNDMHFNLGQTGEKCKTGPMCLLVCALRCYTALAKECAQLGSPGVHRTEMNLHCKP